MTREMRLKLFGTLGALGAMLALLSTSAQIGKAQAGREDSQSKIARGFAIAPVRLNLTGKNRARVGLGSYLVNAVGDCNGCHYSGSSEYAAGGNPFMGQPKQVNQAGYLGGGNSQFGPIFLPRNLTPDKTGLPAGGTSFEEFVQIIRTGIDPDHAHPQFGPYLQVMPWPAFHDMTDNDLRAIYEYLSAIPCVEGDPGLPNPRPIGSRCQ